MDFIFDVTLKVTIFCIFFCIGMALQPVVPYILTAIVNLR